MSYNLRHLTASSSLTLWLFLATLLVAAVMTGFGANGYDIGRAWTQATTRQPEPYTELFFDNPGQLPAYAPARKPQTISFHIINHESRTTTYRYVTTITINGATSIEEGSVRLADGQAAHEPFMFTLKAPNQTAQITVELLGTNQQLSFRSQS